MRETPHLSLRAEARRNVAKSLAKDVELVSTATELCGRIVPNGLSIVPVPSAMIDLSGHIIEVNDLLSDLYGVPGGQLLGRSALLAMHGQVHRRAFRAALTLVRKHKALPSPIFSVHRRIGGAPIPVRVDWMYLDADDSSSPRICATVQLQSDGPSPHSTPPQADAELSEAADTAPASIPPIETIDTREPLTRREQDILHLLLRGMALSAISRLLFVSIHTVRNHTKSIYRKCDVHSREELLSNILRNWQGRSALRHKC